MRNSKSSQYHMDQGSHSLTDRLDMLHAGILITSFKMNGITNYLTESSPAIYGATTLRSRPFTSIIISLTGALTSFPP